MNISLRACLALTLTLSLAGCGGGFHPLGFLHRDRGGSDVPPPSVASPADAPADAAVADAEPADTVPPSVPPVAAQGDLGTTVASLGDPTRSGLWLETPLVQAETAGTLVAENGERVDVTLIPSGGAPGSGSRISVLAMQALGLSLTDLATLTVIAGG